MVKADLNRNVALGILEKVLDNTPVTWQSHMHVVARKDRSCKQTVDLGLLNMATIHQMHIMESPFIQASRIPAHTWMNEHVEWLTKLSLDEDSRELTTFLTPWGR